MKRYISRRVAVLAAAGVVAATAACSTEPVDISATPEPVADTSSAAAVAPQDTVDEAFLKQIGDQGLPATSKSIDAAKATCDALDAGNSPSVLTNLAAEQFGNYLGGYFVGASVAAYCSWNTSLIMGGGQR